MIATFCRSCRRPGGDRPRRGRSPRRRGRFRTRSRPRAGCRLRCSTSCTRRSCSACCCRARPTGSKPIPSPSSTSSKPSPKPMRPPPGASARPAAARCRRPISTCRWRMRSSAIRARCWPGDPVPRSARSNAKAATGSPACGPLPPAAGTRPGSARIVRSTPPTARPGCDANGVHAGAHHAGADRGRRVDRHLEHRRPARHRQRPVRAERLLRPVRSFDHPRIRPRMPRERSALSHGLPAPATRSALPASPAASPAARSTISSTSARNKVPRGAKSALRDNAVVQTDLAQAEVNLRAARGFVLQSMAEIWKDLVRRRQHHGRAAHHGAHGRHPRHPQGARGGRLRL